MLILIVYSVSAQDGYYYLSHYTINEKYSDRKINSIVFDTTSTLFLANRKGVAVFDGSTWSHVLNIPLNVLVLQLDSVHNRIYAGMKGEFGVISRDPYGRFMYEALIEYTDSNEEFNQIILNDDKLIFYSDRSIYEIQGNDLKNVFELENPDNLEYSGIFVRRSSREIDGEIKKVGTVYVNVKGKGICKSENGNLNLVPGGNKFKNTKILFYTTFNAYNIIFGTDDNKLFELGL
jgi:hypothetical protein